MFPYLVSVSDCPGAVTTRTHLNVKNSLGTPLPYDLKMPVVQATPVLPVGENFPAQDQQMPGIGLWMNFVIFTSFFEVGGETPHELMNGPRANGSAFSHGPVLRFCHFMRCGRV